MFKKLLLFLLLPVAAFAQTGHVTRFSAPLAGVVELRSVEDKYSAMIQNLEAPLAEGDEEEDLKKLLEAKEKVAELFPRKVNRARSKTVNTLPVPVVDKGYIADTISGIPPDNDMALSKDNVAVSVINSVFSVIDGNTGTLAYRRALGFISSAVKLTTLNDSKYDPKIQYDPVADRFITVMLNGTNQYNYIVVGFSLSNDPAGKWAFYKFYGDYKGDTTWFDYPGVVLTENELFLTGNKIKYGQPWQAGFTESVIYQINKKDGYDSSSSLTYQIWDGIKYNGKSIRNLFPVRPGRGMKGPAQYFLSNRNFDVQNDSIFLIKVPDVISANNKNLEVKHLKTPIKYGVPPNGRQPDTSVVLATNDGRILGAYSMNGEIQFVSTSVDPANGSSGIFHARISNYDSVPEITYAAIYSVDSLDFGYPNISYTGDSTGENYSVISFDYTGPATYPGLGVMFNFDSKYSEMVRVKEGDSSIKWISGKSQRWGDYTGAQVDFNDTSSVWISGIFGRKNNRYGSWMAKIKCPYQTVYPVKEEDTKLTKFYPNPVQEYVNYEFYMPADGAVKFRIYSMDGKVADDLIYQNVKKGRNNIQFNTGHLARGMYILKGVRDSGKIVVNEKFQKL